MEEGKARRERLTTFEEAARLDPDEVEGELDAGRLVPVVKNTWRHGGILANVTVALKEYASRNPGWYVASGDPGTKLAHDPDVLRGPDVGIVRRERLPTGSGAAGWLEGAPDVAVEIVGDGQSVAQLLKKALEYLRAGARAVWVLDPDARSVVVITAGNPFRVIEGDGVLDAEDALPGFSCKISIFFEI